jgi:hypothetical protein
MSESERRAKKRYPLQLNIRFRSTQGKLLVIGDGRTLNISSAGLLIASPQDVRKGLRLQLTVAWPWLLDDTTPLQLVAESRVVRASECEFAVSLERYQFRTSRRQSTPVDPLIWAARAAQADRTSDSWPVVSSPGASARNELLGRVRSMPARTAPTDGQMLTSATKSSAAKASFSRR